MANCDSTTADGKPIAAWTGGLAGIPVMPRGSGAALERYWLWNVGNSPEVDAGFARLGLPTAAVPGIRLDVTPAAGLKEALADVPARESAYKLEARVVDAAAVPLMARASSGIGGHRASSRSPTRSPTAASCRGTAPSPPPRGPDSPGWSGPTRPASRC